MSSAFQDYFHRHEPAPFITRGRNDEIFGPAGAEAYTRDLPDAERHPLDTGRFALEEELDSIARIRDLLSRHVAEPGTEEPCTSNSSGATR